MKLWRLVSKPRVVSLSAIVAMGLFLRLWGLRFGLPYEYHADEMQYVMQAAGMGAKGLEPVWWNNPPFYKYVLLAEYAGLYGIGKYLGWYASVSDFGAQHLIDPTRLYLLGRITSAVCGTLTLLLAYWIGKSAYNRRVGLLSAWFLAVCFIHVRDSHYAVNDIPVTFLMTLAVLAAIRILDSSSLRWYVFGGLAVGLGFATKYNAILSLVPLSLAHFFSKDVSVQGKLSLQLRRLLVLGAVAVVAAIAASPYFVLTPGRVIQDAYQSLYLAGQSGFDGWEIDVAGGYVYYLKSLAWGLGWGLLILALAGLFAALLRHRPEDIVLSSLPLTMYLMMAGQQMFFARFILPAVPTLLVLGASLLERAVGQLRTSRAGVQAAVAVSCVVLAAQPLVQSVRADYLLTRTDTRTLAKQWIEANLPEGAKIAVDWPIHGPPLSTQQIAVPDSDRIYEVTTIGGSGLADHPITWYHEQGFDYLVSSSFIYQIPLADARQDAERRAFYNSLDQELELAQAFRPGLGVEEPPFIFDEIYGPAVSLWQRERPGPTIKIYRLQHRES